MTTSDIDIDSIIDKSYSEMTDEEIAAVIDYKAEIKARDSEHQKRLNVIETATTKMLESVQEQTTLAENAQDALLQASLQRLANITTDPGSDTEEIKAYE